MLCCAVPCCADCCAVSCRAVLITVLCRAVPCRAVPCRAVPCRAVLCCAVLCCALLCYAVLCCAVPCCAVLCPAVLCRAVPCCAVPYLTVPCYVTLCDEAAARQGAKSWTAGRGTDSPLSRSAAGGSRGVPGRGKSTRRGGTRHTSRVYLARPGVSGQRWWGAVGKGGVQTICRGASNFDLGHCYKTGRKTNTWRLR